MLIALVVGVSAGAVSAVQVTLPPNAVINAIGQTTVVPVDIASTDGVNGVGVNFTYDSSIATATMVVGTALTSNCLIASNIATPGVVRITAGCSPSLPSGMSGTIFNVTFQGVANGVTPLTFTDAPLIPDGCLINEGSPTCEPVNGQLTVGEVVPTATATNTAVNTATPTRTATPTITDTPTVGPSPTNTHTPTASQTPTVTNTPQNTFTATPTATVTNTAVATATQTPTNTATATPVPTPRITSGAIGGSTRVFGSGARNLAAPGIEIVAENGGEVLGTGGTDGDGRFTDGQIGIGLSRALISGERIFPRDVVNGVSGPLVTVAPQPPAQIPTLGQYGAGGLILLLGVALVRQLVALRRRAA